MRPLRRAAAVAELLGRRRVVRLGEPFLGLAAAPPRIVLRQRTERQEIPLGRIRKSQLPLRHDERKANAWIRIERRPRLFQILPQAPPPAPADCRATVRSPVPMRPASSRPRSLASPRSRRVQRSHPRRLSIVLRVAGRRAAGPLRRSHRIARATAAPAPRADDPAAGARAREYVSAARSSFPAAR